MSATFLPASNRRWVALRHDLRAARVALSSLDPMIKELAVLAQIERLARSSVIQTAWASGRGPRLHGWVYRLDDGVLRELVRVDPEAVTG